MTALKWIRLARNILKSNAEKYGYKNHLPFKLNYVVTKKCHSRCQNCHIWLEKPTGELTLEEIQEFTRKNPLFSWVNLTGGEPSERDDLPLIAKSFIDNCPDLLLLHFPTNGLNPERVEAFAKQIVSFSPPTMVVTVSIDGPPRDNDLIRGVKGNFESSIETLKRLQKIEGVKAMVGMTLFPRNAALIEKTLSAIKERVSGFSIKNFHVNIGHISSHYYGNQAVTKRVNVDLIHSIRAYQKLRGIPASPLDWLERTYQKHAQQYLSTGVTPQSCAALLASCYLSEKGELYPCTIWSEALGNIRESNFELLPLLKSERAVHLRQLITQKKCPNCWTPCEAYQTILSNVT